MGCCNGKRGQVTRTLPKPPETRPRRTERSATQTVGFEYMGETGLSVLGPITRTRYHFSAPGARVEVDRRDAGYFAGVPNLRRAR